MKTLKSNTSFLGKEVLHCKKSSVTIRKWHITSICTLFRVHLLTSMGMFGDKQGDS